jgi:predicted Zn-dependent protease
MLNALVLTAVLALPSGAQGPRTLTPNLRVDQLVELAWKQADDVQIDEKRQKDLDRDTALGKEYTKEVDKQLKASKNEEYVKRVQKIGAEMAAIANKTQAVVTWGDKRPAKFNYEFHVVEGEDVNAFSLPGGYIYVYEGLIKYVESDDELAGVLAHEISHAAFRHVWALQRQSEKLQIAQILAVLVAVATKSRAAGDIALTTQLTNQAFLSGWSQNAEEAADYGGLQFMLKSKYNPSGMVTMMERLARDEKSRPNIDLGIFRTHPPSKDRVRSLTAYMAQANYPLRRSAVTKTFRTQIKPGEDGTVEAWFSDRRIYTFAGSDAIARADAAAEKLNAFFDAIPQMVDVTDGNGVVLYNFRPLLEVKSVDAQAQNMSVQTLTEQTTKIIKGTLFSLGFRVWG